MDHSTVSLARRSIAPANGAVIGEKPAAIAGITGTILFLV